MSSDRFKALIDTNFYGVVYMTRAALPVMRSVCSEIGDKHSRTAAFE
jgi:NAD(P)-dependent dehydrogenase (short-subunit alcohol dehydrogenase family)